MSFMDDVISAVGGQDNATALAVVTSVALIIGTTVLIWFLRRSRALGRAILLVGLNGAGKTLMYAQLRFNEEKETFTSIKENVGKLTLEVGTTVKTVDLMDIPGHDSLRSLILEKNMPAARGIIFVVDSVNFSKELQDVAKLLYSILANALVARNRLPILVACSKQDIATAKSAKLIKQMLEKEIDALRTTRAAALSDTNDQRSAAMVAVGREGKEFAFADVHPIRLEVTECSSRKLTATSSERNANLTAVQSWIAAQS